MPIGVVYTVEDAKRAKSTTTINIPSATTLADAQEFALSMGQLLATLLTGRITSIGIHFSVSIATLTSNSRGSLSDVEEGAKFGWEAGTFKASNRLATFDESFILASSKQVDQADTDVLAFLNAMTVGLTMASTNVVAPVDYRDTDIDSVLWALEDFTSSRKMRI